MYAYSITYGVYESNHIFKTGTIGVKLKERNSPEMLKHYLEDAITWIQPSYEVRILNWKEISLPEYERVFSNRVQTDLI